MSADKNILLIAYYFPPLGMGGVGRSYALFRHLPNHGYRVTILTVKNIVYPEYDHTRLEGSDEENIIRTGSYDPSRLMYLAGLRKKAVSGGAQFSAPRCYFPDSKRGWVGPAYRAAMRILSTRDYAAVISTSPPPSAHLVGLKIKAKTGLPWIADFRDLWFSLPIEKLYRTSIQENYAENLKRKIVDKADEIVGVNNSIVKYLGRGRKITNGAEIKTAQLWRKIKSGSKEKLVIGVLGTINELCPIEPLFRAVALVAGNNKVTADKISIVHVGGYDRTMMTSLIKKYDLQNIVSLKGYLPKEEAIAALSWSDLLYFSVAAVDWYHILPGRIFDYLMSAKPIIGVVPSGSDAESLLREYNNGVVVTEPDSEMIASYILGRLDTSNEKDDVMPDQDRDYEKYSTGYVAKRYAEILDGVIR